MPAIHANGPGGCRGLLAVLLAALWLIATGSAGAAPPKAAGAQPEVGQRHLLYDDGVRVEAMLAEGEQFLGLRTRTYELVVSRGEEEFRVSTTLLGVADEREALARLQAGVGQKGKYLFVREECGGGNAWRCSVDHVFLMRGERLVTLGTIFAHPESREAGGGYDGGWFQDVYDKLEINALTSHAAAPAFRIWIQEIDGRLAADLGRTWRENRARFAERARLYRTGAGSAGAGREGEVLRAALLHNAALARYCGKEAETQAVLSSARSLLDAEVYGRLAGELSSVEPGELPGAPE